MLLKPTKQGYKRTIIIEFNNAEGGSYICMFIEHSNVFVCMNTDNCDLYVIELCNYFVAVIVAYVHFACQYAGMST